MGTQHGAVLLRAHASVCSYTEMTKPPQSDKHMTQRHYNPAVQRMHSLSEVTKTSVTTVEHLVARG